MEFTEWIRIYGNELKLVTDLVECTFQHLTKIDKYKLGKDDEKNLTFNFIFKPEIKNVLSVFLEPNGFLTTIKNRLVFPIGKYYDCKFSCKEVSDYTNSIYNLANNTIKLVYPIFDDGKIKKEVDW